MIVRLCDIRALNYCSRGARGWFERRGLDWADFVANGIQAEILIATDDAMALAAVAEARKREALRG